MRIQNLVFLLCQKSILYLILLFTTDALASLYDAILCLTRASSLIPKRRLLFNTFLS